jgi:hypothetical protein
VRPGLGLPKFACLAGANPVWSFSQDFQAAMLLVSCCRFKTAPHVRFSFLDSMRAGASPFFIFLGKQ